jgi:hypothetical protein
MRLSFLFIYLFASLVSYGQLVKIESIKRANPITKEIYIFPKVIISNSLLATQKVNKKLRETVLGILEETLDSNIFDSIWRTSYRMENISNLSFKVDELSSSLISLSISGEGCGAYCEAFNYYFTFNSKTGNQLTLDSLFTSQGLITFVNTLNYNKRRKLKTKLKQINQSLTSANAKTDPAEKERYSEMLSMYTECLLKKVDIAYINYIQFIIQSGTLIVYTNRCSAHYNMAYDELWTFVDRIVLRSSKKLLNHYGLSLLNK